VIESRLSGRPAKVLAVASGGGHWVQLCRLLKVLDHSRLICATTVLGDASLVAADQVYRIHDGNRWNKWGLLRSAADVGAIVARTRPDVVLTTGAAPGYFALRAGKCIGARTIWLDSIANADVLSMAGRKAGKYADLWLTQWPELATPQGPHYAGSVLPVFEMKSQDHQKMPRPALEML